jgi:hypothetical protein
VELKYNKETVALDDILKIRDSLPVFVASELSGSEPGASLNSDDIEVCVREFSPDDIDNGYDVAITVDANEWPSRRANLKDRSDEIAESLRLSDTVLGDGRKKLKAFVWIRLMPAAFTEL